ncbi:MAG: hypothetical protein ACE5EO_08590 [Candidatus Krumholzibacteriia bacterium]
MNSIHHILLIGATVAVAASCAHVPRSLKQTEATESLRTLYLREHPDGRFNDRIGNAEIVVGMGVMEVLASWGIPDRRLATGPHRETWTYASRDEFSKDSVSYSLIFRRRVLSSWESGRTTAAVGSQPPPGIEESTPGRPPVLVAPRGAFKAGDRTPKK